MRPCGAAERSGDPDIGIYVGHIVYFSGINLHLYMTTICRNLKEYFNVIPSTIRIRGDTGRVLIRPQGDFIRLEWHPHNGATAVRLAACIFFARSCATH